MLIFQILKLILGYKLDIFGANQRAKKSKRKNSITQGKKLKVATIKTESIFKGILFGPFCKPKLILKLMLIFVVIIDPCILQIAMLHAPKPQTTAGVEVST